MQVEGRNNNNNVKTNNFIEYRPGAFKDASASSNRIKTARVRGEHIKLLGGGGINEDELEGGDLQMMTSVSSPRNNEDFMLTMTARKQTAQQNKKVIMHVNRFIPFYMQFHSLTP
jgi:hypothetical protein